MLKGVDQARSSVPRLARMARFSNTIQARHLIGQRTVVLTAIEGRWERECSRSARYTCRRIYCEPIEVRGWSPGRVQAMINEIVPYSTVYSTYWI